MFAWLKSLFSNPKVVIKVAIDSLDLAVVYLAKEIDAIKDKPFNKMTSLEQAQFAIDKSQDYLRKCFNVEDPPIV